MVAYFHEAIKILILTSTDPTCIFNDFPTLKFPDIYKCTHFKLESLCTFMKLACFPKLYSKKIKFIPILLEILIISTLFPVRTNIRLFGIRFQGPKCFNLQSTATISLFKTTLKVFLLSWFSVLQWFFSAPVVICLIKLHVLFCWTGT